MIARKHFRTGDRSKYGKRHKPGQMNKTESEYATILQARLLAGEIESWKFEGMKFRLGDNCFYTPDFNIQHNDGSFECVDTKGAGPIDPKSIVKIKCAAEMFPQFIFSVEQKLPKKLGGGWKRTEY